MMPLNEHVPGLVHLRVGDVVELGGEPHMVDYVNDCRARVRPMSRKVVKVKTRFGKEAEFQQDRKSVNITCRLEPSSVLERRGEQGLKDFLAARSKRGLALLAVFLLLICSSLSVQAGGRFIFYPSWYGQRPARLPVHHSISSVQRLADYGTNQFRLFRTNSKWVNLTLRIEQQFPIADNLKAKADATEQVIQAKCTAHQDATVDKAGAKTLWASYWRVADYIYMMDQQRRVIEAEIKLRKIL